MLTSEIQGNIRCSGDELLFERTGRPARHFKPELRDVFFEPGQPRTRRIFVHDDRGTAGFVERREATDVVWQRANSAK